MRHLIGAASPAMCSLRASTFSKWDPQVRPTADVAARSPRSVHFCTSDIISSGRRSDQTRGVRRICLFMKWKKHGRMMLDSIDNGPLVYPTVEENRQTRPKKYSKLAEAQQLEDDCDVQATNIILYGLPPDVYALVNHQEAAKDIWDRGETLKFITDVKLAKSLYTTNYGQLYAYLSQHERDANEVRITRERYSDPLAFVANSPTLYNPS
ncbi:hypothetical protein Tco_1093845 [Tanacetum coccineum]|uniref:Uncharacterized protein n=1 Tax=Tanacetum coccineum TaxID=301880 RepID=A0ABQ5IDV5_9ASTR